MQQVEVFKQRNNEHSIISKNNNITTINIHLAFIFRAAKIKQEYFVYERLENTETSEKHRLKDKDMVITIKKNFF